jgi:hypothetical protein
MDFLSALTGGFNPEKMTHDTIQGTLENIAEEYGLSYTDFFVMIKPCNEEFSMIFKIYRTDNGKAEFVREIELKEILNTD